MQTTKPIITKKESLGNSTDVSTLTTKELAEFHAKICKQREIASHAEQTQVFIELE